MLPSHVWNCICSFLGTNSKETVRLSLMSKETAQHVWGQIQDLRTSDVIHAWIGSPYNAPARFTNLHTLKLRICQRYPHELLFLSVSNFPKLVRLTIQWPGISTILLDPNITLRKLTLYGDDALQKVFLSQTSLWELSLKQMRASWHLWNWKDGFPSLSTLKGTQVLDVHQWCKWKTHFPQLRSFLIRQVSLPSLSIPWELDCLTIDKVILPKLEMEHSKQLLKFHLCVESLTHLSFMDQDVCISPEQTVQPVPHMSHMQDEYPLHPSHLLHPRVPKYPPISLRIDLRFPQLRELTLILDPGAWKWWKPYINKHSFPNLQKLRCDPTSAEFSTPVDCPIDLSICPSLHTIESQFLHFPQHMKNHTCLEEARIIWRPPTQFFNLSSLRVLEFSPARGVHYKLGNLPNLRSLSIFPYDGDSYRIAWDIMGKQISPPQPRSLRDGFYPKIASVCIPVRPNMLEHDSLQVNQVLQTMTRMPSLQAATLVCLADCPLPELALRLLIHTRQDLQSLHIYKGWISSLSLFSYDLRTLVMVHVGIQFLALTNFPHLHTLRILPTQFLVMEICSLPQLRTIELGGMIEVRAKDVSHHAQWKHDVTQYTVPSGQFRMIFPPKLSSIENKP